MIERSGSRAASKGRLLLTRKETFLDELFCDLDSVGGSAFAQVVSHAPEVET